MNEEIPKEPRVVQFITFLNTQSFEKKSFLLCETAKYLIINYSSQSTTEPPHLRQKENIVTKVSEQVNRVGIKLLKLK